MGKLVQIKKSSPYGKAVLDGVPRYTSASSLTTADPNSYGGCLRRWWYNKVMGFEEPETAAQRKGVKELHDPIEHYYETGARAFAPFVQAGFHHMPERGADLLIEREIAVPLHLPNPPRDLPEGAPRIDLSGAVLHADGIPLVGRVDLTHARGWYIANGGELTREDPAMVVVETKDWKSTSNPDYAKTGDQLRTAIQMVTYGNWAARVVPPMTHNRSSHVYFLTRGSPKSWKATTLMDREHLASQWEYVDGVARSMRHAAAETDVEKVPGNAKACGAYFKGCPHRSRCSIGSHNSIPSFVGLAAKLNEQPQTDEGDPIMSLLKTLGIGAPAPDATAGVAAALNLQGQVATPTPQNPIGQLMQTAPNPIAAIVEQAAPALAERVRTAFDMIQSAQLGQPPYAGEVAKWYAIHTGAQPAPSGKLAGYQNIGTLDDLIKLATDVAEYVKSTQPQQPVDSVAQMIAQTTAPLPTATRPAGAQVPTVNPLVPPETPPSKPELAALPVEGFGTVPVAMVTTQAAATPATTQAANPVPLNITTATMINAAAEGAGAPAEVVKPKRTRKKKSEGEAQAAAAGVAVFDAEMTLYVDAIPSTEYTRLQPQVDKWCAAIASYYQVDPPDIRCATRDPLGMGKWKGVLASAVREQAKTLGKGALVIHTRDSEINKIVAEALESALDTNGEPVFDNIVKGI